MQHLERAIRRDFENGSVPEWAAAVRDAVEVAAASLDECLWLAPFQVLVEDVKNRDRCGVPIDECDSGTGGRAANPSHEVAVSRFDEPVWAGVVGGVGR